ncbi:MAG: rhodanese-like domain-containing protein [Pseudomonadota bacterium]
MELLNREIIQREGLPADAHIIEMVSDAEDCQECRHFPGMECLPLTDIKYVPEHYDASTPLVIHCDRAERCTLAEEELGRFGFKNVYRYDGELRDLEDWMAAHRPAAGFAAPVISALGLESQLKIRGQNTKLLNIVTDASRCQRVLGVTCLEPAAIENELKGTSHEDAVVFRSEEGIDRRVISKALYEMGFKDVRVFEGDYRDISWLHRM